MGIAIAVIYLPILGVLIGAALFLAKQLGNPEHCPTLHDGNTTVRTAGAVATTTLILIAARYVPDPDGYGFNLLFRQMAFTLVGPFVVCLALIFLSRLNVLQNIYSWLPAVLYQLGIGSLHSVWFTPIAVYAVFRLAYEN